MEKRRDTVRAMCSLCHMWLPRQQGGKHHPVGRRGSVGRLARLLSFPRLRHRGKKENAEMELPVAIRVVRAGTRGKREEGEGGREGVDGGVVCVCVCACVCACVFQGYYCK